MREQAERGGSRSADAGPFAPFCQEPNGTVRIGPRPAAYAYGEDVPPVAVRHKVRRHYVMSHRKRHHARRIYRGAQPGYVQ